MKTIRTLAPTIFDALNAVEQGCRKIQDDSDFVPDMSIFCSIVNNICYGCLATTTLMQLAGKTGKDMLEKITPPPFNKKIAPMNRAVAYDIGISDNDSCMEILSFENAVDCFRQGYLHDLLEFYDLEFHENAQQAKEWYFAHVPSGIGYGTVKSYLLHFADFIKDKLFPRMEKWFSTGQ